MLFRRLPQKEEFHFTIAFQIFINNFFLDCQLHFMFQNII